MLLTQRRATRFAAAIGLLLVCQAGQAQTPPAPDLNPAQIRSGMLVWRIGVNSEDGPSAMVETITQATYQGRRTWRVTHYDQDPASTKVNSFDLYDLDRETLAPIRSVMRNETFDLDLVFTPQEVTLRRVAKDGSDLDERIALKTAVQGEGPGLRVLIASLPLRPGFKFRYHQVDRWGGEGDSRVKPMTVSVVGQTRVRTAFGAQDALEVIIEPDDRSFRIRSHVRAKPPYYPFKVEYVRGEMTLVSEVTTMAFEGGARADGPRSSVAPAGETVWLDVGTGRLKAKVFTGTNANDSPPLLVILHGDAPFHPPSYQYVFARKVVEQRPDVVAAAVLRPGYTDPSGDRSEGERGRTTGDNYTPEIVAAVAEATSLLRNRYRSSEITLVGHSGGAMIAAAILGTAPDLAARALLVSCPCDLPRWREHMKTVSPTPYWDEPVRSLVPLDLVPQMRADVLIRMVVGAEDSVAPPRFSEALAMALTAHGVDVHLSEVPGLEHDILLESVVFDELDRLLVNEIDRTVPK